VKIYLAASYSRRLEMLRRGKDIIALGHKLSCRWIHGGHKMDPAGSRIMQNERFAREDLEDLRAADCMIFFSALPGVASKGKGGRHVEFGYALAFGKRLIVIGAPENVFHYLPRIEVCPDWPSFLSWFRSLPNRPRVVCARCSSVLRPGGGPNVLRICAVCREESKR
jgi:hypothetical protein